MPKLLLATDSSSAKRTFNIYSSCLNNGIKNKPKAIMCAGSIRVRRGDTEGFFEKLYGTGDIQKDRVHEGRYMTVSSGVQRGAMSG